MKDKIKTQDDILRVRDEMIAAVISLRHDVIELQAELADQGNREATGDAIGLLETVEMCLRDIDPIDEPRAIII